MVRRRRLCGRSALVLCQRDRAEIYSIDIEVWLDVGVLEAVAVHIKPRICAVRNMAWIVLTICVFKVDDLTQLPTTRIYARCGVSDFVRALASNPTRI